mmetsp:Transcript_67012/g.111360  ORF Transcript_67012/g.111360 Transcript_67012/m.111360 type:complete len:202 (+) Transcript_67012:391-996(+)
MAIQQELMGVEGGELRPMRNRYNSKALSHTIAKESALKILLACGCWLIQKGHFGFAQQHTSCAQALLLTSRERVSTAPLVKGRGSGGQVRESSPFQSLQKRFVRSIPQGASRIARGASRRIKQLLLDGSVAHNVWSLWQRHHFTRRQSRHRSRRRPPYASKHTHQRSLAAAVRSSDQQPLCRAEAQAQALDKNSTVRRCNC